MDSADLHLEIDESVAQLPSMTSVTTTFDETALEDGNNDTHQNKNSKHHDIEMELEDENNNNQENNEMELEDNMEVPPKRRTGPNLKTSDLKKKWKQNTQGRKFRAHEETLDEEDDDDDNSNGNDNNRNDKSESPEVSTVWISNTCSSTLRMYKSRFDAYWTSLAHHWPNASRISSWKKILDTCATNNNSSCVVNTSIEKYSALISNCIDLVVTQTTKPPNLQIAKQSSQVRRSRRIRRQRAKAKGKASQQGTAGTKRKKRKKGKAEIDSENEDDSDDEDDRDNRNDNGNENEIYIDYDNDKNDIDMVNTQNTIAVTDTLGGPAEIVGWIKKREAANWANHKFSSILHQSTLLIFGIGLKVDMKPRDYYMISSIGAKKRELPKKLFVNAFFKNTMTLSKRQDLLFQTMLDIFLNPHSKNFTFGYIMRQNDLRKPFINYLKHVYGIDIVSSGTGDVNQEQEEEEDNESNSNSNNNTNSNKNKSKDENNEMDNNKEDRKDKSKDDRNDNSKEDRKDKSKDDTKENSKDDNNEMEYDSNEEEEEDEDFDIDFIVNKEKSTELYTKAVTKHLQRMFENDMMSLLQYLMCSIEWGMAEVKWHVYNHGDAQQLGKSVLEKQQSNTYNGVWFAAQVLKAIKQREDIEHKIVLNASVAAHVAWPPLARLFAAEEWDEIQSLTMEDLTGEYVNRMDLKLLSIFDKIYSQHTNLDYKPQKTNDPSVEEVKLI